MTDLVLIRQTTIPDMDRPCPGDILPHVDPNLIIMVWCSASRQLLWCWSLGDGQFVITLLCVLLTCRRTDNEPTVANDNGYVLVMNPCQWYCWCYLLLGQ